MSDTTNNDVSKKRKVDGDVASSQSPETPETRKSDRFYDDNGTLEILSSDGVLFKVHAFQLQWASPVFRAMIGTSSGSRLELCDPTLETSKALTGFLDPLINSSDIPLSNLLDPFPVVKLCLKYDCEGLLKQIRNQLRCAVLDQNVTESNILVLGGILGQLDICKEAIHGPTALKAVWKRNAGNQSPERFGASLRGGRVLDPAALAYSDFRAISPAFMWSWMRAYRIAHPPPGVIEPTAAASMSSELQRLADLPGAPKPLGGP